MVCKDRHGNIISNNEGQDEFLKKLYNKRIGRMLIKVLINPSISKLGGLLLNSRLSKLGIKPFITSNSINMDDYEDKNFKSYNDFFMRKIKEDKRKIENDSDILISPCDSKLMVYNISPKSQFTIKNTVYTMENLVKNEAIAKEYENGQLLLFRLTVDDYHRYCYIDNGIKSKNYRIEGLFHTVNPIANDHYPIYKENTREYSVLQSENFGNVLMMEVGALMVGKIVNYHENLEVKKGQEKGRFEFGGSTVIICLKEGQAIIDEDILNNTFDGIETKVQYGEKIGRKMEKK